MKLNNIWGYGQLFGFSALDGPNRYYNDFVGTLTKKKIGIRFELKHWVKVLFPIKGRIVFKAITGDFIDARTTAGDFFITFADADTLVGYSPILPELIGEKPLKHTLTWGTDVYYNETDSFGIICRKENESYKFCIHHSFCYTEARSGVNYHINDDVEKIKAERYAYYEKLPLCRNKKYERLYYKCLSVNKVNTHTAEGKIPCMWTTPDRVPHRHMWLWDSVFHALAIVNYNPDLAKNCIRSILSQIRSDGFMPHMMNPTDSSDVTQPQVISYGVWKVYEKTGDKDFLADNVHALGAYLEWDMKNRDKNGNGLLEWLTEPDYAECRCGESGLDNSPRFDFDYDMDAIDFSAFLANDAHYLSLIYKELKDNENAEKWQKIYEKVGKRINELLWDDNDGCYYDRTFDGNLTHVITPSSFLPMFAKTASEEQAQRLVENLVKDDLLWTPFPVATIAKSHPAYSNDMWRGGVWLHHNYFIIEGLKNYGYYDVADHIRNKTLATVNKWYLKTGAIFEFFDPEDKLIPYYCSRKGNGANPPDWRKHVHSIVDFNWSACFSLLFIQNET